MRDQVIRRFLAQQVGEYQLPKDHLFGMQVPKGGSSCANCKYVSEDKKNCGNPYFYDWQKSLKVEDPSKLPAPANEYCCDVFSA